MTRCVNGLPGREGREMGQAEVNADCSAAWLQGLSFLLNLNTDEVAPCRGLADGDLLDLPLDRAVQYACHPADLRQIDVSRMSLVRQLDPLRVATGLLLMLALEFG